MSSCGLSDGELYAAEKEHSQFLEDLLRTLYGDGWEKLTMAKAKNCKIIKDRRNHQTS